MFQQEINRISEGMNAHYFMPAMKLYEGLVQRNEEHELEATPSRPATDRESDQDALLANWETERLLPSSTNLRAVSLMSNGVTTGESGLAQVCTPPVRETREVRNAKIEAIGFIKGEK
jgi:hypothetical protein